MNTINYAEVASKINLILDQRGFKTKITGVLQDSLIVDVSGDDDLDEVLDAIYEETLEFMKGCVR